MSLSACTRTHENIHNQKQGPLLAATASAMPKKSKDKSKKVTKWLANKLASSPKNVSDISINRRVCLYVWHCFIRMPYTWKAWTPILVLLTSFFVYFVTSYLCQTIRWRGDITKLKIDAITNAANSGCAPQSRAQIH